MTLLSQSRSYTQGWLKAVRNLVSAGALIGVATFAAEPTTLSPSPAASSVGNDSQRGTILLTVFLRHDQANRWMKSTPNSGNKVTTKPFLQPASK